MKWALGIVAAIACGGGPTYKLLHVYVPDPSLAVTRDMAADRVRLSSHDLVNRGAVLATRTFTGTTSVLCEELPPGALVCEIDHGDIRVLDARTLADKADIAALIKRAIPSAQVGADYANFLVHTDGTFDVPIGDATDARIDLATAKVTAVTVTPPRGLRGGDAARCLGYTGGTDHHGVRWTIDSGKLLRKRVVVEVDPAAVELEVPAVAEPIASGSILDCGRYKDAVLAMSYNGDASQLARLDDTGTARWTADLGAHPDDILVLGDWILVTTGTASRRLIAVDLLTGAIRWVSG